ncbi:MAG: hypothetical protein JSR93_08545 [Verrucomicrobia bacterium]|nr:hypothetical protein [Verrucomicrobiota bacterium]
MVTIYNRSLSRSPAIEDIHAYLTKMQDPEEHDAEPPCDSEQLAVLTTEHCLTREPSPFSPDDCEEDLFIPSLQTLERRV